MATIILKNENLKQYYIDNYPNDDIVFEGIVINSKTESATKAVPQVIEEIQEIKEEQLEVTEEVKKINLKNKK